MHLRCTLHGLERHHLLADAGRYAVQRLVLHRHYNRVGRGRVGVREVLQISELVENPLDFTDLGDLQWCRGEGSYSALITLTIFIHEFKSSVCAEPCLWNTMYIRS